MPGLKANLGVAYSQDDFDLALTMHHQGKVERRDSDSSLIPFDCDYDGDIEAGTGDSTKGAGRRTSAFRDDLQQPRVVVSSESLLRGS